MANSTEEDIEEKSKTELMNKILKSTNMTLLSYQLNQTYKIT